MADTKSISGVKQFQLTWQADRMIVLGEDDHLLRRFGQVDLLDLQPEMCLTTYRQKGADEIWIIVSGSANVVLTDLREQSPTDQVSMEFSMLETDSRGIFIPFGVKAELSSVSPGLLLRLTTHADQLTPLDQIFESEDRVT